MSKKDLLFTKENINEFLDEWKIKSESKTELQIYFENNYIIDCRNTYKLNGITYYKNDKTKLYTDYKENLCARRDYDITLLNDINIILKNKDKDYIYDYIIIRNKYKLDEIVAILIIVKGECKNNLYKDVWSISYICAKKSKAGTAPVMIGLCIYVLKKIKS
jgi:hypothetical protein